MWGDTSAEVIRKKWVKRKHLKEDAGMSYIHETRKKIKWGMRFKSSNNALPLSMPTFYLYIY